MSIAASFIVPTWRRAEVLDLSIPLFLGQDMDPDSFEVIVVSDGPDPDADAVAARHAAPALHYEALSENRGPAAARNHAIARARGRILVFVDDDSLVKPDFLRAHLSRHEEGDDRLVTGPIVDVTVPPDMSAPPPVRLTHLHMNPLPTGNASVARARVESAGGFDESFRRYGWEDPELYWRLRCQKPRRRFATDAPIYHLKPQNHESTFPARLRRELERGANGAAFYGKHPAFAVGLQTRQLGAFHGLDRAADALLGLDARMRGILDGGPEPQSPFLRWLLLVHAEISGGRGERRNGPHAD